MPHLEIDTHNTQPLRQALYGFNTNMMSGDYGYLDPDFVELTKTLAPKDIAISRRDRRKLLSLGTGRLS